MRRTRCRTFRTRKPAASTGVEVEGSVCRMPSVWVMLRVAEMTLGPHFLP